MAKRNRCGSCHQENAGSVCYVKEQGLNYYTIIPQKREKH